MSDSLADRYRDIQSRIQAACLKAKRDPASVTLIAVSKTKPFEQIQALYLLGHRDFGENYVQELAEKAQLARGAGLTEIRWHLIGHLQTNKVKTVLPIVSMIHTVDSVRLAEEIQKRANQPVSVLLEVNVDGEGTKAGVTPEAVAELVQKLQRLPHLSLRGLMCIPRPDHDGSPFESLKKLASTMQPSHREILSMGMSDDFEKAIALGATHIRVGSAIFGARS